jgi:hypothetical protein
MNTQGGFQKKLNTYPHIVMTHDLHKIGRNAIAFIDLKAAYDRVPISRILEILQERKTPNRIINLIFSLFANCSSNVTINQEQSKEFTKECGLFQGSLLSPLLFNIFIDVLAKSLQDEVEKKGFKEIHKGDLLAPFFLMYADDIQINGRSLEEVQSLLDILGQWCDENNMLPGYKKCQWVGKHDLEGVLKLNRTVLEKVKSYMYLGVPMTFEGIDFHEYMPQLLNKPGLHEEFFWISLTLSQAPFDQGLCSFSFGIRPAPFQFMARQ